MPPLHLLHSLLLQAGGGGTDWRADDGREDVEREEGGGLHSTFCAPPPTRLLVTGTYRKAAEERMEVTRCCGAVLLVLSVMS